MDNDSAQQTARLDLEISGNAALVLVDVQKGFDAYPQPRNNPGAEANIAALADAWQDSARPVVFVRHDSREPDSPLRPGQPGNDLQDFVAERRGKGSPDRESLITKHVNSAFLGDPDLAHWLTERGIGQIVLAGVQTNFCAETTARMGGNLGFDVVFALDATYTFDLEGPHGWSLTADELYRATAVNLHGGGFARVVRTEEILKAA
ncbi:cysteine hydrolase family protein [Streptomyces sp. ODS28]|uniref:cysteine hydrolase family protein n=1 Tax=Streptomyces sp. ODS28 TaxID=3136688 RepID=UPI0031EDFEF5